MPGNTSVPLLMRLLPFDFWRTTGALSADESTADSIARIGRLSYAGRKVSPSTVPFTMFGGLRAGSRKGP
jgi:hypothetical protein